jgi:hypothetical protein
MIRQFVISLVLAGLGSVAVAAQTIPPPPTDAPRHHDDSHDMATLFPSREASGTSWLPALTPMSGAMRQWRGWSVMLHGNVFGQLIAEPGDRHRTGGTSDHQTSSVNWGMVMARRALGGGRFGIRAMGSAEPWTVSDCGFLNFLATGEMCEGDTIHDRQHPHDLFMELAADYDHGLRGSLRWQVYAGFAGEPALGPVSFPHRISALANPVAPITHHWIDATHITFGLVTAGVYDERWKAEVSLFNGREPDEDRADLDLGALDSISGRFTVMPSENLVLQVSAGQLEEAEAEFPPEPRADVDRLTASATYHRRIGDRLSATTLAYGVNSGVEVIPGARVDLVTHALLLESSLTIRQTHTWFARMEIVGKPGEDLHVHEDPTRIFVVGKLQAGYERTLKGWRGLVPGVGGSVTLAIVPPELELRYSGRYSPGYVMFVSLRPRSHIMAGVR